MFYAFGSHLLFCCLFDVVVGVVSVPVVTVLFICLFASLLAWYCVVLYAMFHLLLRQ